MKTVTRVSPPTDVQILSKKRSQFLDVSYSGKQLLSKYPLDTVGTWRVRGEDANCDFSGSHYMPELGIFQGKLSDVVDMAVMLPNFWQWGGGGDITLVDIVPVDKNSVIKMAALKAERAALKARLAELDKQIGG